jgi:Ala-tRNA(Pro) deacylase
MQAAEVLMELLKKLRLFLDENLVEYTHTVHPLAYTAREVASAEHLPNREVAKTVVVSDDEGFHMIVLPANRFVDFQEVRLTLGLTHARLATEQELGQLFPDCETGAMPPMGNLYGIPVYLDSSLAAEETIAFNGGTHFDVVHMRTDDYRRLVQPTVVSLAREAAMRHGW